MGELGGKKLLSLAGLATVIVAPLSILGWHSKDSSSQQLSAQNSGDQSQQAQASQANQLNNIGQASQTQTSAAEPAGGTSSSSQTTITVNGQEIPLSSDGHTHSVVQGGGSTTTLDVSVNNDVSGNAANSHSLNSVSFSTQSETTVDGLSINN